MMKRCPRCKQMFSWNPKMGNDYVHNCSSGKKVLDKEPVLKTGKYEDYSGSGGNPDIGHQGAGTIAGGDALILGEKVHTKNVWGKNKNMYRERKHHEYIENVEEL